MGKISSTEAEAMPSRRAPGSRRLRGVRAGHQDLDGRVVGVCRHLDVELDLRPSAITGRLWVVSSAEFRGSKDLLPSPVG